MTCSDAPPPRGTCSGVRPFSPAESPAKRAARLLGDAGVTSIARGTLRVTVETRRGSQPLAMVAAGVLGGVAWTLAR